MKAKTFSGTSTHSMGGRLLAFLLVFTMLFGVCPAAFADGEKVSVGTASVNFTGTKIADGTVDTGADFGLQVSVTFNSNNDGGNNDGGVENPQIRLYIGAMDAETLPSITGGGKIAGETYIADGVKYTVMYDESKAENYLLIEKYDTENQTTVPWIGGNTFSKTLTAEFDSIATNGTEWNVRIDVTDSDGNSILKDTPPSDSVTAKSSVTMSNTKKASQSNIIVDNDATVLGSEKNIVYTLSAYTGDAPDTDTKLADGEAAVTEYTVTDTLTLPAGLYIAESDLSSAISSSYAGYTVAAAETENGNVTSFTVTWTVKNNNSGKQIADFESTLTLNGAYVNVDDSFTNKSADKAEITNTISTVYKTANDPSVENSVEPVTATTYAYRPEPGNYTQGTKSIYGAVSNYDTWNSGWGYLVEGDYVLYKISYKNASQDEALNGGTVTDTLPDGVAIVTNLTDAEAQSLYSKFWIGSTDSFKAGAWAESGDTPVISGNTVTFSNITTPAEGTFTAYILAKVTATTTTTITNTASIGGTDVSASFENQKKTPKLNISKTVVNNDRDDNTRYEAGDSVTYTVTVSNNGTADMNGISLRDMFPKAYMTMDGITSDVAYKVVDDANDDSVDKYYFDDFDLAAGATKTITIKGTVKSDADAATIRNSATAEWTNPNTSEKTTVSDTATLTRISPATYVTIEKQGDKDGQYVKAGGTVTYTINVDLDGKTFTEAEPLVVSDQLPSVLEYVSSSYESDNADMAEPTTEGNTVKYTITGTGKIVITVETKVKDDAANDTAITNTAIVSGGSSASSGTAYVGTPDDMTAVKSATVYRTNESGVEEVVGTIKDGESAVVQAGDRLVFDIVVTNNSEDTINEFILYDTLIGKYKIENVDGDPQLWVDPYPIKMTVKAFDQVTGVDGNYYWWITDSPVDFVGNMYYDSDYTSKPYTVDKEKGVIESYGVSEIKFTTKNDNGLPTRWYNSNFSIAPGGSLTLTYSVTAAEDFTAGSNSVSVDALQTNTSTVRYAVATPEPTPSPDPNATPNPDATAAPTAEPETSVILSIDKQLTDYAGNGATSDRIFTSTSGLTGTAAELYYTIKLKNESNTDYVTTNATILDYLPDEVRLKFQQDGNVWGVASDISAVTIDGVNLAKMEEDDDFADSSKWESRSTVYNSLTSKNLYPSVYDEYNAIAISFSNGTDSDGKKIFTLPAGKYITIVYALLISDTTKSELQAEIAGNGTWYFDERKATNTAYFTGDTYFKNTDGTTTRVIADTQTVTLRSETAHPGLEKKAYAYIQPAGDEIEYTTAGTQPGDRLIWHFTIKNDKDTNGTGAAMTSYTLTDKLPSGYQYVADQTFTTSNKTDPVTYPADLSEVNLKTGKFVIHRSGSDTPELVAYDAAGITFSTNEIDNTVTWKFNAADNPALKLEAGDWLEFTIITEPDSDVYKSGVYYNKAELKVDNQYYESTVSVGTVEDGKITDGDSFSMNTILTSGSISASATVGGETVTKSGADADDNILPVDSDTTTVTYTLEVRNADTTGQAIKNLAIINRLPYVGDSGVLVSGQRGSQFDAIYADSENKTYVPKVIIHRAKDNSDEELAADQYTFTTYSGDTSRVFTETSVDWTQLDADGWSEEYDASTKLIRINIGNDDNPITLEPGDYVSVEYYVTLPAGESTALTGWNGFAYRYDSYDGTITNMAAEPASVGVEIPAATALTGSIRVKKVFASDKASEKTFYFICEDDAGERHGDIKSVTLKSPGSLKQVNAEVTFTDLPYTSIGKSVYYTIWETDADGNKLQQANTDFTMYTGFYRTDMYTYDFTDKTNPVVKQGDTAVTNNIAYVTDTAGLRKGLSPSITSNSAIFSNILFSQAKGVTMGPFYADVPFSLATADANMTSTRTIDEDNNTIATQQSSDRGAKLFDDSKTIYAGAYDGFGGSQHGHTIATGFFAEVTPGSDTVSALSWNIKINPSNTNDVYVRAKTGSTKLGDLFDLDSTAAYTDGSGETGYSIYKVTNDKSSYELKIQDDKIPTISGSGTAYIGIIIDQLYDRNASATLTFDSTDKTVSKDGGDVTVNGTAVIQGQKLHGLTSINYEIALNDANNYVNAAEGAALKASVIEELAKNGITLDTGTLFHDTQHGTMNLQTIDIDAPGPLKITIGDCKFGADTVKLFTESGALLDEANMKIGCYHNGGATVVLEYTGTAQKLQVKFSSGTYVPYLKVESTSTGAAEEATPTPTVETPTTYHPESDTIISADTQIYTDDNIDITSVFGVDISDNIKYDNVFANNAKSGYSFDLRINADIKENVSNVTSTGGEITQATNYTNATALILDVKKSGTLTTYIGVSANTDNGRTIHLWDNTENEDAHDIQYPSETSVIESTFDVEAGHQYILYTRGFTGSFIGLKLDPPTTGE